MRTNLITITTSVAFLANLVFLSCNAATTTLITTSKGKDGSKEYRLQENSIDLNGASISASTTSKVTTSNKPEPVKFDTIPLNVYITNPGKPSKTTKTTTISGGYAHVLDGYVGTGLAAGANYVRPEGSLPILPDRFGFEAFPIYNANGAPNCGCVLRGACSGQVGSYTQEVLKFSDIVCGHQFQTCCFDGPWPGSYDIFASAAACVPKEECRRPYGVLPTDVRDFGTIPPCPGLGAVRCILVDNAGFMEFQAALAAIEAANVHQYNLQQTEVEYDNENPYHIVVPIVTAAGSTGEVNTDVETTSTLTIDGKPVPLPQKEAEKVIVNQPLPVPVSTTVQEPPKTIVIVVPPPKLEQPPATLISNPPVPPKVIVEPPTTTTTIIEPPPSKVVVQPPTTTTTIIQAPPSKVVVQPPAPTSTIISAQPPATTNTIISVPTPARVPPTGVAVQQPGGPYYGYGGYRGAYGAYPSVIGGFPGYGLGGGFGFRKRIRISKGFGYGFGF